MDLELVGLDPKVYKRAAELIASGEFWLSCQAVTAAADERSTNSWVHRKTYEVWFGWESNPSAISHPFWNKHRTRRRQQYRQNALLLMAAMVRSANKEARKSRSVAT